ncbi:MAG: TRAP transporter small permease [Desulfomonile tiedjei]|uniref:TRAP transporter small permease n=1 Tax=Desulfomonile tiedjei TaxID=2358 RepID=A0A9D6UXB7_9BACT|nr:TRAP transporter small permease [Desulfomonile tiedjei]
MLVQVKWLSSFLSMIAGVILLVMMGVTLADIVLRYLGRPIVGAYEIVAFLGVAVIALALPRASILKTHVYVDLLIDKLPAKSRKVLRVVTRILVFSMFLVAAWYFILMGKSYIATKTVTMSLKVPFYPVVFALAASCIVQCLVSLCEIFGDDGGNNE